MSHVWICCSQFIFIQRSVHMLCSLYVLMLSIDIRSIYCSPLGLAFALSLVSKQHISFSSRHSDIRNLFLNDVQIKSVWLDSALLVLNRRKECAQCNALEAWRDRLFTYLVEQQSDQIAACCESLFTGLALYLPFDILSCCESLYSNRRHNLCVPGRSALAPPASFL